jgi:hypothetical protein
MWIAGRLFRAGYAAVLMASVVSTLSAEKVAKCPDDRPWYGKVQIWTFGFEFVIPKGLKAYWNSPGCSHDVTYGCVCMGDHGRIIPLGAKGDAADRQIEMYADLGAGLEEWTLAEAVKNRLDPSFQPEITKERMIENQSFHLAGREARRVVFRYVDQKSGRRMVEESVVCVTHKRPAQYVLYLRTPAEDYAKDKLVFEAMVQTFRWTPGEYGPA